jgi:mono/diheme cytochrome c family protein
MVELEGPPVSNLRGYPLLEHPPPLTAAFTHTEWLQMAKKSGSGGFGKVFLGFLLGIAAVAIGLFGYLKFGRLPVAVADAPLPFEKQIVKVPLGARIERESKTAPFGISEDVFESGAHVYREHCAACHGTPGHDVGYAKYMFPSAPQLWKQHGSHGVVGVSDDETGETYWKVANGIRLSGMPSYKHVLSDTQMWQVSLLLKNADKELPGPVAAILHAPAP